MLQFLGANFFFFSFTFCNLLYADIKIHESLTLSIYFSLFKCSFINILFPKFNSNYFDNLLLVIIIIANDCQNNFN